MEIKPNGSAHLVDPELLPLINSWVVPEFSDESISLLREAQASARKPLEPIALGVTVTEQMVRGPSGAPDVRVLIYRPEGLSERTGCILHMHGGGYIAGDPDALEPGHRQLASDLVCVIVSVDYRLAPETCAPGAVEDCYAALAWLVSEAESLQIDPKRIGVAGESAGGGLAAALSLLVRDRGEYTLAFQHLIYPMLDDRTCTTTTPNTFAGEFIWSPRNNRFGWKCLLGFEPGGVDVSPYAAAARATDLAGLPPTYISVGALDLFIDENLEFARRLIRSGVPAELHVYPGAYHGFELDPNPRIGQISLSMSKAALSQALDRR